jgi:hypothetical protein
MATKKITDLQLIDAVVDELSIPGDDGIQTYRATAAQLKAYILPDSGVTTAKINDSAVTTAKVNDAAITEAKLASAVVLFAKAFAKGYIWGFKPAWVSSSEISFSAGVCRSSADDFNAISTSTITKQISGPSNNTTYHVWLIRDNDDDALDVYYDTSITGANVAAGQTLVRRLFSIKTDGSGNFLDFDSYEISGGGIQTNYATPIKDVDNAAPGGTSAVTVTLSLPTGLELDAIFSGSFSNASATSPAYRFSSLAQADVAPTNTDYCNMNGYRDTSNGSRGAGQFRIRTNTSAQIRSRASANLAYSIGTEGWIDDRR